jgi:ribosomal protein L37AE/L43A
LRWPDGVRCVECGSDRVGFLKTRSIWKCRACGKPFSVKKGTIFEDRSPLSPYALVAVSAAAAMARNVNNGIHTREARCIVVP